MDLDQFLKDLGIKDFDDLTSDEKESYRKMLDIQSSSTISLDDFKTNIRLMRESVELTLATEKLDKEKDLFLKARLKNYILFESFFDRPERAKKLLDDYAKRAKGR